MWSLVIPIRDPRTGKSRLRAGAAINAAIAHDTLAAALRCSAVDRVIVVTDDTDWLDDEIIGTPGLQLVPQQSRGLTEAVTEGLAHATPGPTAVMLGDLPGLKPECLTQALSAAHQVPLGMVTDHCGTGTTLITAQAAGHHRPSFGVNSAAIHRSLGYFELPVPADSRLRWDVDTPEDLAEARIRGLGPATLHALAHTEVLAS